MLQLHLGPGCRQVALNSTEPDDDASVQLATPSFQLAAPLPAPFLSLSFPPLCPSLTEPEKARRQAAPSLSKLVADVTPAANGKPNLS
jgi:hypothetical protein